MEKEVKKTCSFYVSEYHLVTMLLPYIKQKIDEKAIIKTILEENIEENMEKLVKNINLETNCKNEILSINWKSFQAYNFPNIEKALENGKITNIIISGKYDYVEMINKTIENYIENSYINYKIVINNCYDVTDLKTNINEILERHDKILNTSGEQNIELILPNKKKVVKTN